MSDQAAIRTDRVGAAGSSAAGVRDRRIRQEVGPDGIGEVWMIKQVVEFKAKLQFQTLRQGSVLIHGEIKLTKGRPDQGVSTEIAKVAGTRSAGIGETVGYTVGAGHGKRSELKKLRRIAVVVPDGTDHIRFREKGAGTVEVIGLKNHVEGLPGLHRQNAV